MVQAIPSASWVSYWNYRGSDWWLSHCHYNDVIMSLIASQITSLTIVYSTVYSDADQRKYQSSASLAFVRGIHRGPVNSPQKGPVRRKMFPFDDVIMWYIHLQFASSHWYLNHIICISIYQTELYSVSSLRHQPHRFDLHIHRGLLKAKEALWQINRACLPYLNTSEALFGLELNRCSIRYVIASLVVSR